MKTLVATLTKGLAAVVALSALAACSTTDISRSTSLKASSAPATVAFGELRLITNGVKARLGDGLLAGDAGLYLASEDTQKTYVGRVERAGKFNMRLEPGRYRVTGVYFRYQGETIEADTNFVFDVSDQHEATYVGTITLEATLDNSNYGIVGTADRISVSNACASDCDRRMAAIGLPHGETAVSLFHWEERVASSD